MPPGKDSGSKAHKGDEKTTGTAPEAPPETTAGDPAAFPVVTPGDDVAPSPERPPSPLTRTDDGGGVILDPEAGDPFVVVPAAELGTEIAARGADGREYIADNRADADGNRSGEVRWAVSVIETKVPYAERPTRGLLDTPEQVADRQYEAVVRPLDPNDPRSQRGAPDAPDDDPLYPVGTTAWWRARLTEAEVTTLRDADSVESVTYEHKIGPVGSEWAARFTGTDFGGPAWRAREARRAELGQGGRER